MDCPPKNGRCREVTVSVGSTVVALNKTSDRVTVFIWFYFRMIRESGTGNREPGTGNGTMKNGN